ncbi:hypothetical protein CVD28_06955 [Bacillus sp. M6-12]|nr:hypothetical protein CVD28_06955 [Bacillus sp. M6-12]
MRLPKRIFFTPGCCREVKESKKAAGLGIYSAAKVMGLDFVPVADESYNLFMKTSFFLKASN